MDNTNTSDTSPVASQPDNGSTGPIIGTLIILAVIVLGGFYFWTERNTDDSLITEDQVNAEIQDINTQSDSDEVSSIEADLNATEVDNIDSELNAY